MIPHKFACKESKDTLSSSDFFQQICSATGYWVLKVHLPWLRFVSLRMKRCMQLECAKGLRVKRFGS